MTVSYWPGKLDPKVQPEHHVACFAAVDGKRLWDVKVEPGPWTFGDLARGVHRADARGRCRARVRRLRSSVLAALDHSGKQLWRKEIRPFKFDVALAASPVLVGDTVVMQCDENDKQSRLLAFDKKTGDVKWEQFRRRTGSHTATPVLAKVGDKPQLLVAASNALQGVDPDTGKVLWTCAAKGDTFRRCSAAAWCTSTAGAADPGSRSIPPAPAT